jgi:acetate kinase
MKVLVINTGSSSIKFQLFDLRTSLAIAVGLLEQIGESKGRQSYQLLSSDEVVKETTNAFSLKNHQAGLKQMASWLAQSNVLKNTQELTGIGHRVVHGGAEFTEPTIINEQVLAAIRNQIPLAPLKNPPNLLGIELAMAQCHEIPQVAVFDTAFHHTIPAHAHLYALPRQLAKKHHIRRYGFHGISHKYVSQEAARLLHKPLDQINLIVLHLGNGASATAILCGRSIDTSMGMTPLEGLSWVQDAATSTQVSFCIWRRSQVCLSKKSTLY